MVSYLDLFYLQTKKYSQYLVFEQCFKFVNGKKHLTIEGLSQAYLFQRTLREAYK
jgi:hypothetical protein